MLRFILEKLKLQISKKKRKANRKKGKVTYLATATKPAH
jgi:hypothetical protein